MEPPDNLRPSRRSGPAFKDAAPGNIRWPYSVLAMMLMALFVIAYDSLAPRIMAQPWRDVLLGVVLVLATGIYSVVMFRMIARQEASIRKSRELIRQQRDRLESLRRATFALTTLYDLDTVLQHVVEAAKTLVGAKYAALAVLQQGTEDLPPGTAQRIAAFYTAGLAQEERRRLGGLPKGFGLLGEVIRSKQTIRLTRIQDHPASVGFPPNHPPMDTFLGVPLIYQQQVVGHLYLTNKSGGFTAEDQETVEQFAEQAAVIIANAELNAQVRRAGMLQERSRIAMELHDGILQELYGIRLSLENTLDREEGNLAPEIERLLAVSIDRLSASMSDLRFFLQDLKGNPMEWETALRDLILRVNVLNRPVRVVPPLEGPPLVLPPDRLRNVLLQVQEVLSNAFRYSGSTDVRVSWKTEADASGSRFLTVSVADNGQGFDPETVNAMTHHGLKNLKARAEGMGGRVAVQSRKNRGTLVRLTVPLGEEPPALSPDDPQAKWPSGIGTAD